MTSREERVRHVANLMARGEWRTSLSPALAAEWSLSESAVRNISAEASRFVRAHMPDTEELRTNVCAFLERIQHDAAMAVGLEAPDYKAAVAATKLLADVSGLVVQKTELSGKVQIAAEKLSPEEQDRQLREHVVAWLREDSSRWDWLRSEMATEVPLLVAGAYE